MSEANGPTARAELTIQNRLGLHARAAALLVQALAPLDAEISVSKDGETVNGKSIMGLMMLAAGKGSTILVEARGPAAEEAIRTVRELVEAKFHEAE
jgi:phosphotransferase system HPr (HPr) family protein